MTTGAGRIFEVDTRLIGNAFKRGKVYRTRHYDSLKVFEADLAADMRRLIRDDLFPLESTIRQLKRYGDTWRNPTWDGMVLAILTALRKRR